MAKNILSNKKLIFLFILCALVVIILIIVNKSTFKKSSIDIPKKDLAAVTGEIAAVSDKSAILNCLEDLIIEGNNKVLRARSIDGKINWSQSLNDKIIRIMTAGEYIVVLDNSKTIYYMSKHGKLLWNSKLSYELVDIYTEDNGSVLIEYKYNNNGARIEYYDNKGTKTSNIALEKSSIIDFSSAGNSFALAIIDISGEALKSKIICYKKNGEMDWAKNLDYDFITAIQYQKGKLVALGEKKLYEYDQNGKEKEQVVLNGTITSFAMKENMLVVAYQEKGAYKITTFSSNLKKEGEILYPENPTGIRIGENKFLIFDIDKITIYSIDGADILKFNSGTDISNTYFVNDSRVAVVTNRKLQLIESR